ncbi:hypothetical protein HanIR_Chr04g0195141 [Helianthus annuus]|nr:hypothetical protein HanIR_Chr04g0195141 [Helianthus annuus]
MSWMSVRLAVQLRFSLNYDESRNGRENNPNCATNENFCIPITKIQYFNDYKNFWMYAWADPLFVGRGPRTPIFLKKKQ